LAWHWGESCSCCESAEIGGANVTVSRTHTGFSLCFQVDVIQNRPGSEHAKVRRMQAAASPFSLYFRLVVPVGQARTVHQPQDYGGVIYTAMALLKCFVPMSKCEGSHGPRPSDLRGSGNGTVRSGRSAGPCGDSCPGRKGVTHPLVLHGRLHEPGDHRLPCERHLQGNDELVGGGRLPIEREGDERAGR